MNHPYAAVSVGARSGADREAIGEGPNPLGVLGIEFIEYATSKPQALGNVLETMGFKPVARHRSREILLYRQGELNIIVRVTALNETIIQNKTRADQQGAAATLLQAQLGETKADSVKLQTQVDNARARATQLTALVDKTKAGAAELQTQLDKSRAISNGFQSQMEDAKVVSIRHQGEVEVANAQVTVLQNQLNEARTDIARLQEQVTASRDDTAALQAKLDTAESEIARMKKAR